MRHMLDSARKALEFARGRSRSDLDKNEMLALALVRLLEVLGEAPKPFPRSFAEVTLKFPGSSLPELETALFTGTSTWTSILSGKLSRLIFHR